MAFVTLDDDTAQIEISIFNELFETARNWLKEDQLLIVEGKASHDDYSGGIRVVADKLYDLVAARGHFAKMMRIKCNGQANAAKLMELLKPYRSGSCPVAIEYHNKEALCELMLGEDWRVNLRDELIVSLNHFFSEDNVRIIYN
jgi:DNA polymerase-3 subunit alpha